MIIKSFPLSPLTKYSLTSLSLCDQNSTSLEGTVQLHGFPTVVIGNHQTLLGVQLNQHHLYV